MLMEYRDVAVPIAMIYTWFFIRASALIRLHFAWTPPDHVLDKTLIASPAGPI